MFFLHSDLHGQVYMIALERDLELLNGKFSKLEKLFKWLKVRAKIVEWESFKRLMNLHIDNIRASLATTQLHMDLVLIMAKKFQFHIIDKNKVEIS